MKRIAISILSLFLCAYLFAQQKQIEKDSFYVLSPVEVRAVRAADNAPLSKTNLSKQQIDKTNLGQDIPFILNQTPSVVINSDAGNGIGYTGIHIRGTDATRINITLNGIPYNDAEGQGSFFVDLPDFISSVGSIQIQRGVGTSSSGAGAFGASINFSTNEISRDSYSEFSNSYGSFNTWKNTIKAGSGLIDGHFTTDLRLSRISSDGFIDRASSDLKSFYFSTAYIAKKSSLRLNIILGKEKTYQAWNGISEMDLKAGNRTINYAGTEKPGDPYDNETDNYWQNHYQLFFNQSLGKRISFNTAVFYTKGKGYYEEYRADQSYSLYNVPFPIHGNDTTFNSDFIRQLWLDNDFYGDIFSLQYKDNKTIATLGGGYTRYKGNHFGELIWASNGLQIPNYHWYDLNALKTDFNLYVKDQTQFIKNWYYFYDLQYRHINYNINGFSDNPSLLIQNTYDFFNPKAGISYSRNGWNGYLSYSFANKEPNRDDFEANINEQPKPEKLRDLEFGIDRKKTNYSWSVTLYSMRYKDQLVLTGKINDVGAYTRTNIPKSYRMGIELQEAVKFNSWMNVIANIAFSRNKVLNFSEFIDDYDNGGQKINNYKTTDIAYSPDIVGGATINLLPLQNLELSFLSKYVSKQFLDNTQHQDRTLNPFFVQDARTTYSLHKGILKHANIILQVNNIFNKKYEPNGYTYNYISGGDLLVNNYYFPMAGTNLMIAVSVKF